MSSGFRPYASPLIAALVLAFAGPVSAETPFAGMLDTTTIGAVDFVKSHPSADGRGVAIAVLDSGVDMGVPGLLKTSDGRQKVVVARDFTREGLVECRKASKSVANGVTLWRNDSGFVKNLVLPVGDNEPVYLGFLDEKRYRNADLPDLNYNGRSEDRYAVVAYRLPDSTWQVAFDNDGDWDMADAVTLGSFETSFQTSRFKVQNPTMSSSPVTVAINIEQAGGDVVNVDFHLATGAHGTHVAGIAAGSAIAGEQLYNGIAPGAQILSLKIGHSALAGGATVSRSMKAALDFAARWGRERNMPVIVNLSYGVGSEVEGYSDIDRFCDEFAINNPHVLIVASAGNQGPGLSTIGTPAASGGVLTVGAVLSPMTGSDLLGVDPLPGTVVYSISSRGGEVAKPDVVAPGIAVSTVPAWLKNDIMGGTSMAAPQVAGAVALMLSAMLQENPDARWNSGMVRRALRQSARPLRGYTSMDQGAGVVNVESAWQTFRKAIAGKNGVLLQSIKVEVDVPTLGGRKGGAVYWRAAGWVPSRDQAATVRVSPVFSSLADGSARAGWFQRFKIKADQPWVGLSRHSFHIKGQGEAFFDTWIESRPGLKPGVHVANITGTSDDGIEFRFPVTVVVPYPVVPENGMNRIRLQDLRVDRAGLIRIPFQIPAGTTAVGVDARASRGQKAQVRLSAYDANGHLIVPLSGSVNSLEGRQISAFVPPADLLDRGTCELVITGSKASASVIDLDLAFGMLDVPEITEFMQYPGKTPVASVEVVNKMDDLFSGTVSGQISGFEVTRDVTVQGDHFSEGFSVGAEFEKVDIEIEFSAEDYAKFTDIAVDVIDREGKSVAHTGFSNRRLRLSVPGAAERQADYRLEIRPGYATGGGGVRMLIRTQYVRKEKVAVTGSVDGGLLVKLYPGVRTRMKFDLGSTPAAIPDGAVWYGQIDFRDRRDHQVRASTRIRARAR